MFSITGPHHWVVRGVTPARELLTWPRNTREEALEQIATVTGSGVCDHAVMFVRAGQGGRLWTIIQGVSTKQSECATTTFARLGYDSAKLFRDGDPEHGPVEMKATASTLWINRGPTGVAAFFELLTHTAPLLMTRGRAMMSALCTKADILSLWVGGGEIDPATIKGPVGRIEITDPRPAGRLLTYDDVVDTSNPACISDRPRWTLPALPRIGG